MTAHIPVMTDENSRDKLFPKSHQWLWNPWTWLASIAALPALMAVPEIRVLRNEHLLDKELIRRGYATERDYGWLRSKIPRGVVSYEYPVFGDRICQFDIYLARYDHKPLDDLIPKLQSLPNLEVLEFVSPNCHDGAHAPPVALNESFSRCLRTLNAVKNLRTIVIRGFRKTELSPQFVENLKILNIECVILVAGEPDASEVENLKELPQLKNLVLFSGLDEAKEGARKIQRDRSDIVVEID